MFAATSPSSAQVPATRHHFADVDGHTVFYREAGDPGAPTVVLLHGAPASSFMFRNLIPLLAGEYHVLAPDYLGFGLRHPAAITAIITQSGNAYVDGFIPSFWEPLWAYAADPTPETERPIRAGLTVDSIRWQYTHGEPDPTLVSPDTWLHDHAVLQRPGALDIQLTLLRLYRGNVALYPAVHEWLRSSRIPVLAVWGRNDPIFGPAGAEAFLADVPHAQIELLDGGHFLLEAHVEQVAALIREFLPRTPLVSPAAAKADA